MRTLRSCSVPYSLKLQRIDVDVVWREFVWGGIAGAFGEGMMHPVDTLKTRLQSQIIMNASQVLLSQAYITLCSDFFRFVIFGFI